MTFEKIQNYSMSVSLHVNTSCPTYTNTGADGKADVID